MVVRAHKFTVAGARCGLLAKPDPLRIQSPMFSAVTWSGQVFPSREEINLNTHMIIDKLLAFEVNAY